MEIIFGILAFLVIVTIYRTARIVPNQWAFIIERLGKYAGTLGPGFHILIPFIDKVAYKHSLKEIAIDVPPQSCITKDNISVEIDGVLYIRVVDPVKASYGIRDFKRTTAENHKSLLKMNGENNPYSNSSRLTTTIQLLPVTDIFEMTDEGKPYIQYTIFVRNSDWAEPIEN